MTEFGSSVLTLPRANRGDLGSAMLRGWRPLHGWSARRRLAVGLALVMLAAGLSAAACITMDLGGRETAHVALADAEGRLVSARQTLARLPTLRRDAQDWPQRLHPGNAADDIRNVSQLAAQAGLALIALEPAPSGGAKAQAFRTTKLVAQGGFAQLRDFLDGLAELPELAVPMDLSLRRGVGGLAIAAQLQVFDGLPAIAIAQGTDVSDASADPFAARFGGMPGGKGDEAIRLAGMLIERGRAVALLETADGTTAVQAGSTIAGARVLEVNPGRVLLSMDGTTQTLNWTQEGK
ncbi:MULTISPECIES: hypothetical protein [unclassified Paraburkholderia]|uniref:hypothetical protein n=1 Tax=unclassified Paraburkholderia TaxID=2615204 RepID=UPI002AB1EAF0|nr:MULTISPECIES: hypothetical protein [unclassified Paraburkholderia]